MWICHFAIRVRQERATGGRAHQFLDVALLEWRDFFYPRTGRRVANRHCRPRADSLGRRHGLRLSGRGHWYLPTIYSSFSRREIEISLLDARAGSPPTAAELLARLGNCPEQTVLDQIFKDWERWAAEVLESHLSYPALSFFRSQHSNQSWLGAMTTILDATALVISGVDGIRSEQAKITFAIARHAVVDLAQVVNARYDPNHSDRLPAQELARLREALAKRGIRLNDKPEGEQKLRHLRSLYEAYALGIARNLLITLPPWILSEKKKDNWQSGPWDKAIQASDPDTHPLSDSVQLSVHVEDHF